MAAYNIFINSRRCCVSAKLMHTGHAPSDKVAFTCVQRSTTNVDVVVGTPYPFSGLLRPGPSRLRLQADEQQKLHAYVRGIFLDKLLSIIVYCWSLSLNTLLILVHCATARMPGGLLLCYQQRLPSKAILWQRGDSSFWWLEPQSCNSPHLKRQHHTLAQ